MRLQAMLAFFCVETNDETSNLNEMSDPHREEFITKSRLHDWQKAEVRKANDKTTKYEELNFWHTLGDAKNAAVKSSRYLRVQGVIIEPELRRKLDRLSQLIWNSPVLAFARSVARGAQIAFDGLAPDRSAFLSDPAHRDRFIE
jgi:hypothetical protein